MHSRGHGKIAFLDLARLISEKWKAASEEDLKECQAIVDADKIRFDREMEEYKATTLWMDRMRYSGDSGPLFVEPPKKKKTRRMKSQPAMRVPSQISIVSNETTSSNGDRAKRDPLEMARPNRRNEPFSLPTSASQEWATLTDFASEFLAGEPTGSAQASQDSLEPSTNFVLGTTMSVAELAARLDKESQDILIRALL